MGLFGKPNPAKLRAKGDVNGLIALLEHKDVATRTAAAESLGELRDDRAIEALVKAVLHDPHTDRGADFEDMRRWPVSAAAARALAAIGPQAVAPLMDAMKDPNVNTQPMAFFAIGTLKWRPALEELIRLHEEIKTELAKHQEDMASPQLRKEDPQSQQLVLLLAQAYIVKDEAASWAIKQIRGEERAPAREEAPRKEQPTPAAPAAAVTQAPSRTSEIVARWPSAPAGVCDICNDAIVPDGSHRVPAAEFQSTVRKGYNPHATGRIKGSAVGGLASALGLGDEAATEGWKAMALRDTTDWGLCRLCAEDVARFMAG